MAQPLPQHLLEEYDIVEVAAAWEEAVNNLETEGETLVDNLFSSKQQRLLTRALYSSWTPSANDDHPEEKRKFLADANVGVFSSPFQPPIYERGSGKRYRLRKDWQLPEVGLNLTLWQGEFEGHTDQWLRWCDAAGNVIPTGEERAVRPEARVTETEVQAQREATARQEAEARAAQAETELARLREELERLKAKTSR